ncbi:MAG: hypothetical protein Q9170_000548 [Blastenia crenularia]
MWAHSSSAEGDRAIVRLKGQTIALTAPLHLDGRTSTRAGEVGHDAIIGKQPRDVVMSSKDKELRVQIPTLEEYIIMAPRLVTPIYPADANLIVSLLDLHPDGLHSGLSDDPPIQVLEAGTGHGALTLYLARAIHAANSGLDVSRRDDRQTCTKFSKDKHQAIVHTVDVSSRYSKHAVETISGFRRGLYMRDIKFHVGDISAWIEGHMNAHDHQPFLSHVILDLPSSYTHVERAASALHVDGKLVLFNPSITQVNSAIELVRDRRLPLQLEKVVEVGPAMTGGRVWDVRLAKRRALTQELNEGKTSAKDAEDDRPVSGALDNGGRLDNDDKPDNAGISDNDGGWQVCKPKIGDRISGGGFVALWSKNRTRKDNQ